MRAPYPEEKGGVKKIQSFLGLTGFYRRFIRHYAEIAFPLTELTEKNAKWVWEQRQKEAWDTLVNKICSAPILKQPDFDKEFVLETDASQFGIGAVLLQMGEAKVCSPRKRGPCNCLEYKEVEGVFEQG